MRPIIIAAYLTTLATTAYAQNSTTTSPSNSTIACVQGLKMFVSRGTDEPMGAGATGKLVEVIAQQINGSDYEANPYPASFNAPSNFISVANGTATLRQMVIAYAEACPESKMALFGYSQGAQVTSNVLCGMPAIWAMYAGIDPRQLDALRAFASPLPQNVTKNVVATVLFGDTTHRSESPYNHGNSTGSGVFWRENVGACEAYGDRIRSYCTAEDPFCDVGYELSGTAHLTYVADYGKEVIRYVVDQWGNSDQTQEGSVNVSKEEEPSIAAQEGSSSRTFSVSGLLVAISLLVCGGL